LVQAERKAVSKFKVTETTFEKTNRSKIACKTHLE